MISIGKKFNQQFKLIWIWTEKVNRNISYCFCSDTEFLIIQAKNIVCLLAAEWVLEKKNSWLNVDKINGKLQLFFICIFFFFLNSPKNANDVKKDGGSFVCGGGCKFKMAINNE